MEYWERSGECVTVFGRDLTAMTPVAVMVFCIFVLHLKGRIVDFWVDQGLR